MTNENMAIIGAGIGGLTLATALKQHKIPYTVYESAAELKPLGAGIVLANNAMQVYKLMGIHKTIENAGHKISVMKITDAQLKTLSLIDLTIFENKYGVQNVAIHRGILQKILAEEVGSESIVLSKKLSAIENNRGYNLIFEDTSTRYHPVLIGADGIHSAVRKQLFQSGHIRLSGQVCWRGVCNTHLHEKYGHTAIEAWGKGVRFGWVKINDEQIYWYAVANTPLLTNAPTSLVQLFHTFHSDVLHIIESTAPTAIYFSDISDIRPFSKWHQNKACLIGDAAHATTPNLGQGACQAIEDAYTVAQLLKSKQNVATAFKLYEAIRINKAHKVVNLSRIIGKISHWENSFLTTCRNAMMRFVPTSVNNTSLASIFDTSYLSKL